MMTLEGYKLSENLYKGTRTEVYRGTRISDLQPVIIKVLRNQNPNFNQLVQFRNQYVITRNTEQDAIVRPLALERYGNGYALVMPDDGAIALSDYWPGSSRSLTEFIAIAMQLADALHYLTQERIVHKDIKPANILIHPETGKVKLIDFSISTLLPKEQQQLINPNVLEGTLAYISPEQTGRMNRGIDYRTDFYSLGVTFFELLTGQLPFATTDPMELVHCHIAQAVQFPVDSQVDEVMGAIVLKLMAKNASERYQSALGLQHDLRRCLQQLSATGEINKFELGEYDRSDRFIIPEKLYGREAEVQTLLAAFDRVSAGATEMMLVAGFSGIGKTAVVNEVHKPIVRQRGYFIKGKFDQFNRNIPFSALVQAFRDLMGQIISESDTELQDWKAKIIEAVGENGQVLIDVIPELERIIGKQPPAPELSGIAGQNRFNLLFQRFIQVFTTAKHPLVIFMDDLQWADSASLNLIQLLMAESQTGHLLLLGAYRDNEVFPAHPLILTLNEIGKAQACINTITLQPLSADSLNHLIADTLHTAAAVAQPLTGLVMQKTKGNPFFVTQFLKALYQDRLITFDRDTGHWQCDMAKVQGAALTDDVVEFMVQQLQKLPESTQEVLKLAACIGAQFDLETLAIVSEQSKTDVATVLWKALQSGLVLPIGQVYKFFQDPELVQNKNSVNPPYRFLHDRVQQAAYSLIANAQKSTTHWRIGSLLWQGWSTQQEDRLFDLVNQLNLGKSAISQATQKQQLAQLNLQAGKKAKLSAAYQAAQTYCETGLALLPLETWQTDYQLMYGLHYHAAEAAYLSSNFEQAETFYQTALQHTQTPLDRAMIYRVQMTQYQLQGRNAEAIAIQRQSLQLLGYSIPTDPDRLQNCLDGEIATVNQFLEHHSIEDILDFSKMEDDNQQEILRILQILFYAAWLNGQMTLSLLAVAKMTTLSLQNGNSEMSPFGYVGYGLIANALLKDAAQAYQFGYMAVQLCEQFDNADVRGMTNFLFAADVHSWKRPIREADRYYEDAYKYGMDAGNWLTVSFMMMQSGSDRLTYGKNLDDLYSIAQAHAAFLKHIKSLDNLDALTIGVLQPIRQLLGLTTTSDSFDDRQFSESSYLKKYQNTPYHLGWFYSVKIRHAYLLEQVDRYLDLIPKFNIIEQSLPSHAKIPSTVFYVVLMHLSLIDKANSDEQVALHWQDIKPLEDKLNQWQQDCPENILHKCLLIQAEKARRSGNITEAIEYYERSITQARVQQYDYEVALANELAAKFYLGEGKEKVASGYMQEAYYCYARWGAKAKTDQLETQYRQLLTPILQQPQSNVNLSTTLKETQALGTATTTSSVLDLASAIKAGQAISGEISLDALLSKVMHIVVENAGADRGSLILNHSGRWEIAAQCLDTNCQLSTMPLDDASTLPLSIINTVKRTLQTLLINDIKQDTTFAGDPYLIQQQPLCVFCTPIVHQGQLRGILYLENHLTAGAFTSDRIEVLNLLTAQAAISIENAQLYNTLEQKVKERTAELSEALENLKATQKQLVESEKMAALGGLVAGVAHEINTPIGTSITVASTLADETQSFRDAVKQGQLKRSVLNNYLDLAGESTQLMLTNLNRAGELIGSFKQIATDQSNLERRRFHLKEYLEEVALSLAPQLKQTPHTLTVAGDSDITIESYPGALAQIVTNLVTNSLTHGYPSGEIGQLRWEIRPLGDKVQLEYSDDGCGISQEIRSKIFEPFFTTARHRGGTGLGLHIVYNLVTQKLLGTIEVSSEVGKGTIFVMTLPLSINE